MSQPLEPGNNSIIATETIPSDIVDVQADPHVKEPSLSQIGFRLSRFVLSIIAGFIAFFVIYLFVRHSESTEQFNLSDQTTLSDSAFNRKLAVIRIIQEEKKSQRDFSLQVAQMILLNLLLPVLTAILGYIFASSRNKE
jgi:heme/copper-type cytochrome/quinol oxidase subunit 3